MLWYESEGEHTAEERTAEGMLAAVKAFVLERTTDVVAEKSSTVCVKEVDKKPLKQFSFCAPPHLENAINSFIEEKRQLFAKEGYCISDSRALVMLLEGLLKLPKPPAHENHEKFFIEISVDVSIQRA